MPVSVNASQASTPTGLAGWTSQVVFGLIVAIAAYLRFTDLGADSLWFDEAASWDQATAGGLTDVVAATAADNYPPLHNLILWATIGVLGDGEWTLRLPSAVFGVLNVVAIYWVASLVAGRAAGLIAALLLALSAFPAWYSGEARMYALLALSATLFAGASLRLWTRSSAVNIILVGAAGLALLYSHPYGALTWFCIAGAGAVVCARLSEPGGLRAWRWVALQLVLLAGFLPWAWVLYRRAEAISERDFWIAYPTPAFVFRQIENLLSGPYVLTLVVAAAIAGLWFKPREGGVFGDPPALPPLPARVVAKNLLLPAWAFGPIVLGYLISVTVEPIFIARYLLGSLPAILILAAIGLSRLTTSMPAAAATMAVVAGVTWFAGSGPGPRDDWRGAITLVANCIVRRFAC